MGIYIVTTILSWALLYDCAAGITKKYKKDGYIRVENKDKNKLSDSIYDWIKTILLLSTPILNILFALLVKLLKPYIIQTAIKNMKEEGKLFRNDPNEIIDVKIKDVEENKTEEIIKDASINKSNNLNKEYDSVLSEDILEQLKQEREFFTKEQQNQTPEYENTKGSYRKIYK